MALVPTLAAMVAGMRWRASNYTAVKTAIDFTLNPPSVYAYRTVSGTPATGTWVTIGLDGETTPGWDTAGMHDPSTNTQRVVAQYAGKYHVKARVSFQANATGLRGCSVRLNSGGSITGGTAVCTERVTAPASTEGRASLSLEVQLAVGDYLELFGYQSSGGGLGLSVNDPYENMLQATWIGN